MQTAQAYEEWRRSQGLRPITGVKHSRVVNVSNETWDNLLQLCLNRNLMYRGKPSVPHLLELIADGTLTVVGS